MNDKEKELWRVIDNVIKCCAIELPDGKLSITRADDTRRIQCNDHCDRSKPHRSSCETSCKDVIHLYQHVKGLSTCHGTSDPAKQGR